MASQRASILNLTPDDRDHIRVLLQRHGFHGQFQDRDVELLISWWRNLVEQCQSELVIRRAHFLEDLQIRTALQALLDELRPQGAEVIRAAIEQSDSQYKQMLKEDGEFLLERNIRQSYPKETYFWLYGLPESVRFK